MNNNYNDITNICYEKCIKNGKILIPKDENDKLLFFGDQVKDYEKNIKIIDINGNEKIFYGNDNNIIIELDTIFEKEFKILPDDNYNNITDIFLKNVKLII